MLGIGGGGGGLGVGLLLGVVCAVGKLEQWVWGALLGRGLYVVVWWVVG